MGEQVASGGESDTIDEDHIDSMLASLNMCIPRIAWTGAMMVVGSGRPGDDVDEDPPCNGVILLGWHSEDREAEAESSSEGVRANQKRKILSPLCGCGYKLSAWTVSSR
ncbi:hypothetical protein VPH35_009681 [Triticum aestivum]